MRYNITLKGKDIETFENLNGSYSKITKLLINTLELFRDKTLFDLKTKNYFSNDEIEELIKISIKYELSEISEFLYIDSRIEQLIREKSRKNEEFTILRSLEKKLKKLDFYQLVSIGNLFINIDYNIFSYIKELKEDKNYDYYIIYIQSFFNSKPNYDLVDGGKSQYDKILKNHKKLQSK